MQEIICDITRECYLLSAFLKSEILKESFSHRANPNRSFFFLKPAFLHSSQKASPVYKLLTRCAAQMLIAVIMTVINPITAVVTGHTPAIVTGEGKGATLGQVGFMGRVIQARQVIGVQAHSIGAAAHPLEIRHWEAEVAAVAIRMGGSITVVRT